MSRLEGEVAAGHEVERRADRDSEEGRGLQRPGREADQGDDRGQVVDQRAGGAWPPRSSRAGAGQGSVARDSEAEATAEHEIAAHGAEDRRAPPLAGSARRGHEQRQQQEIHERAEAAHDQELHERRPHAELEGVEPPQVRQVEQLLPERELALPEAAVGEVDRDLHHPLAAALDDELQADLVADRVEVAPRLERLPSQREEAGHGIAHVGERAGQPRGHAAVEPAQEAPVVRRAAALGVARPDHEVRALAELGEHRGDRLGRVAEVGVHADEDVACRPAQAVQHGLAQPAIRGPHQQPHPVLGTIMHQLDRPVAAVVVHDREVEAQPLGARHLGEPVDQVGQVLGFLEGGYDDADARRSLHGAEPTSPVACAR